MTLAYVRQAFEQTDNAARARVRQLEHVRCIHITDPRLGPRG